ncbi:MAG: NADPH-dependent quinone reductase ArsH [Myxococcota bacterium]|nr:NADPH-dependent quinone reductase ArsH [Myxococcota bacterium]
MSRPIRVLGLGGSMSSPSSSMAALKIALEGAREAGAETSLIDVASLNLPMYSPGEEAITPAIRELNDHVHAADGMLWSSPLYHGAISGLFKNALDWLELLHDYKPPYLSGKVIGLISTAGGAQALQAVNNMEFIVRAMRGWAVPLVAPISRAWTVFDGDGQSKDPKIASQLKMLGQEVTRAAARMRDSA